MSNPIALALHGGAGTITRKLMDSELEKKYLAELAGAKDAGYAVLSNGGSALEAVEIVVRMLEDCPLFNAGKGAVFTHEGDHELDASIMEGQNRKAGAVAGVKGIKNPIRLARLVMEKSEHVLLAGEGASSFAAQMGMEKMEKEYYFDQLRHDQWKESLKSGKVQLDHSPLSEKKYGTVGAVACDVHGNVAAATSTGGMTNKRYGRVGDSPIIGSGTYANNLTCAVSCTGDGEFFIRGVVAYDVSCLIEFKAMSLDDAANEVIHKRLHALQGEGGLIAVDSHGNISMPFNTEGMYRAAKNSAGIDAVLIYK